MKGRTAWIVGAVSADRYLLTLEHALPATRQ